EYLDLIDRLLEFSIPAFADEGKSRLTVGIGCTGGRHRSIVFAEELARRLRSEGHEPVEGFHRELERKGGPRGRPGEAHPVRLRRWLQPGIGVKRWLLLMFAGMLLLALGVAHVLRQLSAGQGPGGLVESLIDLVTLQFLPVWLRGAVFGTLGVALFAIGAWR